MKRRAAFLAFLASCSFGANAGGIEDSCMAKDCAVGTVLITSAKKSDFYYACPTRGLAEYTNLVIGLVSLQAAFGAHPNISPVTGEPEYTGQTQELVDSYRASAGVRTFDEAVSSCSRVTKGGKKVTVANNPQDAHVIWVSENKRMSWIPKGHLSPAR